MQFYPDDAPVPESLRTEHLYLTMLAPEHVERDYDAFMSSPERLNVWSGGGWPTPDFTLAENMDDMVMHSNEHKAREAFTFTVMNHDETRCDGCVYIIGWEKVRRRMRLAELPEGSRDFDGITTFWVRDSAFERELDRELVDGLLAWFADEWAFDRALFLVNRGQTRDMQLLESAGLDRLYEFETIRQPGVYFIYGPPA